MNINQILELLLFKLDIQIEVVVIFPSFQGFDALSRVAYHVRNNVKKEFSARLKEPETSAKPWKFNLDKSFDLQRQRDKNRFNTSSIVVSSLIFCVYSTCNVLIILMLR